MRLASAHHAILAKRLARFAGSHYVRDEAGPLVRPILLQNLHQNNVHFGQKRALRPKAGLVRANLDDQVADVILDAIPLLIRQCAPFELDDILQYLQNGMDNVGFVTTMNSARSE